MPQISPLAESGDYAGAKKKAFKAMMITLAVSVPAAAALYIFAPLATGTIFGSLADGERELLITLIRIMAINAVTESLVQTSSACLTALGKPLRSTVTQWTSAILRVAVTAALIMFTPLSIKGAAWAANCAYLVATLMNIWYIIRVNNKKGKGKAYEDYADRAGNYGRRFKPAG